MLGVFAAFLSHFALDLIPHWHYPLRSRIESGEKQSGHGLRFDKSLLKDLSIMAVECVIGTALAVLLASQHSVRLAVLAFAGASFGVLPDFLQFVYHALPVFPFKQFHYAHKEYLHAKLRLDNRPVLGLASQAIIAILSLALLACFAN